MALLEGVEDPRLDLRVDADPGVLELDDEAVGRSSAGGSPGPAGAGRLLVRMVIRPSAGVNLTALWTRFQAICMIRA